MPQLVPVDHDPFAKPEGAGSDNLVPVDHDPFVDDTEPHTTAGGVAASVTRGLAPYAAGAAIGAAAGAPFAGIGAIPGAVAGAGAVGLDQLVTSLYGPLAEKFGWPHAATPQEMTDRVLDVAGIKRASTGIERTIQATAGGAAGALTGAGAAGKVADIATNPTTKAVATRLAESQGCRSVSGALRRDIRPVGRRSWLWACRASRRLHRWWRPAIRQVRCDRCGRDRGRGFAHGDPGAQFRLCAAAGGDH